MSLSHAFNMKRGTWITAQLRASPETEKDDPSVLTMI